MSVAIMPAEKQSGLLSLCAKQLKVAMSDICKNDPMASVMGVTDVMRNTSLGAGKANHKKFAAFIKELITLPPTCVRLLEASTWVSLGPAAPHVARCIHPMPVAAPAQSGCFRGGPWRLLSQIYFEKRC